MASSYTANNGIEKPGVGEQEGAWGGTLNTNFDIIDRVLSGVGSISLSGTTHTLTTTDGTLTDGMYRVLLFTGALGANNTVTISPNDQDKLYFVVNNTTDSGSSGPYSVIIKQGTGATVTVANGAFNIVYADGAGSGAAVVSLLSKDVVFGDDVSLQSDGAVLNFGADDDVTLTHVADTGLLLNSTMQLQFNDASQNITAPNATTLDINATDEVEINATLADVNANLEVSGTYTGGGTMTTGGNIVIPDAGNIGSASDTDAISISSGGAVTFSQTPVFPDGSIAIADLDIDGGTDVGEALVDADLFIVDNGAGGTNRKSALSRLKTYLGSPDKTLTTFKYTATAGQTTFSGNDDASESLSYTVGNLLVILNGATLINGTDYTASNGTSVVLTDAATVGDELIVHAFSTFNLSTQTLTLFKYSATAGQTTFSGSDSASQTLAYTVGMIIVTLNGVVLDTSDYTASNGTSVVLDSGASASDELNIIAFAPFNVSNVTTASADFSIGDDLSFTSDGAIINMGADSDVTITHVHDTGIKLNSTLHLEKSDATTYDATNSSGQVTVGPTIYLENPANANDTVGGQIVFGMRSTEEQARIGATGGSSPALVFGTGDVQAIEIDSNQDLKLTTDSAVLGFGADNDVTITHVADTGIQLETAADSSTNLLQLLSDDAGAGAGPYLRLKRTSGSPADNDNGGIIVMDMENDNNQQFDAVQIMAKATDVSDGSEDSQLNFATMVNGTLTNGLVLENGRINSSAYSPAGSIVQVVQNTSVGQASTSSTSAVDVTNYTVDITPSSASNRVIVMFSAHKQYTLVSGANVQYWHKLVGGNLGVSGKLIPGQPWAGMSAESGGGGLQAKGSYAWIGLDNPESTSAVTYKVQHYVTNASSTGSTYYGQIVAMEVQV